MSSSKPVYEAKMDLTRASPRTILRITLKTPAPPDVHAKWQDACRNIFVIMNQDLRVGAVSKGAPALLSELRGYKCAGTGVTLSEFALDSWKAGGFFLGFEAYLMRINEERILKARNAHDAAMSEDLAGCLKKYELPMSSPNKPPPSSAVRASADSATTSAEGASVLPATSDDKSPKVKVVEGAMKGVCGDYACFVGMAESDASLAAPAEQAVAESSTASRDRDALLVATKTGHKLPVFNRFVLFHLKWLEPEMTEDDVIELLWQTFTNKGFTVSRPQKAAEGDRDAKERKGARVELW